MTPCSGDCQRDLDLLVIRIVMVDGRVVCSRCWIDEHKPRVTAVEPASAPKRSKR